MKNIGFVLFCIGFCTALNGQTIARRVVSACGNSATVNGIVLHYTIGDLIITNISSSGSPSYKLSQGYQQSDSLSGKIGIQNLSYTSKNTVELMPNPAVNTIKIKMFISMPGVLTYTISNSLGQIERIVNSQTIQSGAIEQSIDISALAAGSYFVQVSSNQAGTFFVKNLPLIIIK